MIFNARKAAKSCRYIKYLRTKTVVFIYFVLKLNFSSKIFHNNCFLEQACLDICKQFNMTCTRTNFIIENETIITDVVSCLKKEIVTNFQIKTTTIVNDKTTKLIKK